MSVTSGSKFFGVTVPAGGSETVCLVDNDYDGFLGAELTLTNAALAGGGSKGKTVLEVETAVGERFTMCTLRAGAVDQSRVEMIFSTADGQVTFFADGKDDIHVTGAFWFREDERDGCMYGAPAGGRCCARHRVLREAHDATAPPCDVVGAALERHSPAHNGTWRWRCVFCTAPCALHSAGWCRRRSAKASPSIAWVVASVVRRRT